MKTRPRTFALTAAAVTSLLVLGVVACEIAGWPFLRGPLQSAITNAAGVPVVLDGDFKTHLIWRPRLSIQHMNVAAAAGVPVPHLLDSRNVELEWRWGDVWRWRRGEALRVQRLEASAIDANLVRLADGRASWQLGKADKKPDPEKGLDALPRFGSLIVSSARIEFADKPLDTQLLVMFRGQEGDNAEAGKPAGYQGSVSGRYRALPLELKLRTGGALPLMQDEGSGGQPPAVAVRVEGEAGSAKIVFDGRAAALMGERRFEGAFRLRGPSLGRVAEPLGVTLPMTPPFDLAGNIDYSPGIWHMRADRAAIGRSLLAGDFRYDQRLSPALLSGRLNGSRLALADLGPAVGATEPAAVTAGQPPVVRRVLPQRKFDLPSLRAMNADVAVAIDELDFGSTAVAPLRGLQTRVVLDGGVLRLEDLKAAVAGGRISGSTQLDSRSDSARWAAKLRFAGVDAAGFVRGLRSPQGAASAPKSNQTQALRNERTAARKGGDQPLQAYLTGELSAELQATGTGRSTAEILSSLDGTANLALRDGTMSHLVTELAGLDIAQSLGVLVRGDRPLPLRCARMDLVLRNGVVEPRMAVIDNADSTINITGRIDLRDESLDLRATTRPKDFSPLTLRTPVTVKGTLGAPVVGIDGQRLAGKVLGAVALAAIAAPVAALAALIDPGARATDVDPCVTPPQAKAAAPRAAPDAAAKGAASVSPSGGG